MQSEVIDDSLSVEDEAAKIIEDAEKEAQSIINDAHQKAAAEINAAIAQSAKDGQASLEEAERAMNAHLQELQEKLDDPKKAPDLPEDLVERASDRIVSRILSTGSRNA